MCGIAGLVSLNSDQNIHQTIAEMVSAIPHRGPDGEGIFCYKNMALGHRRLAIIDLTEDAAQPMTSRSGDLVLSFNGEIYNYVELRSELKARDVNSKASLIQRFCFRRMMNGAKAVLRDSMACGPLPFSTNATIASFVHETDLERNRFTSCGRVTGSILDLRSANCCLYKWSRTANRGLLNRFLLGVVGEDVKDSFFEGIEKLPGGHNLTYDIATNKLDVTRYFELSLDEDVLNSDFDENLERFNHLFEHAVAIRMRSDVRVGTCLSGGLDSSSIAALSAEMHRGNAGGKFSAITAKSTEAANDESHFAEMVVTHHKLNWILSSPSYEDFAATISDVTRVQEEPFGSASIVMQYHVMKAAADNGIKVLLDGQGGDEVFMGYERYFVAHIRQLLRQFSLREAFLELHAMGRNNAIMNIPTFMKYMAYFSHAGIRSRRISRRSWFLRDKPSDIAEVRHYAKAMASSFSLQKFELNTANLPPLLRFEDKNSMSQSIETRLPMLDPRLVVFGCSLPVEQKMHDGWSKYILRRGIEGRVPDPICWRRDKIGFAAPQASLTKKHNDEMRPQSAVPGCCGNWLT